MGTIYGTVFALFSAYAVIVCQRGEGFPHVFPITRPRTVQEFAVAVEWNVDFFTLAVCAANAAAAGVVVLCWDAPMKAQAAPALELSNCSLCCSTWRGKHG